MEKARTTRRHVRTGCQVCKQRHLKCDEAVPTCRNCITGGWRCEYVVPVPVIRRRRRTHTTPSPELMTNTPIRGINLYRPTLAVTSNPDDLSDFHYFHDATEHDSYRCYGTQLWSQVALQMSFHDPAVRHAIYALGSLLKESTTREQGEVDFPQRTLGHYTKSVSLLNHGFSSTSFSPRVALVLCLAFIWIELLRDNIAQAIAHSNGGLAILAKCEKLPAEETVEPCLVRALSRFHASVQLHGNPTARLEQVPDAEVGDCFHFTLLPRSFESIDQSRLHLEHITLTTFQTMRRLKRLNSGSTRIPEAQNSADLFSIACVVEGQKKALAQWHEMFFALRTRCASPDPQELAAMGIFEVQATAQKLMLACLDQPFEMCFDAEEFREGFSRIVNISQELSLNKHFKSSFQLSLDIGLLPALFFVALKCRVPELRMKAIDLMRACPHREGLWQRSRLLQVATWKAQKEGLSAALPAADARICMETADVEPNDHGPDRIVMRYRQGMEAREIREMRDDTISKALASMSDMI